MRLELYWRGEARMGLFWGKIDARPEMAMDSPCLHHVALPCSNLERSRQFYREILGLEEIPRPSLPMAGAWFRIGDRQELHLIVGDAQATFRGGKSLDTNDIHFALRIKSHEQMLEFLKTRGYREDTDANDLMGMRTSTRVGYPQIYILDPDRNIIEINTESAD